MALTFVAGVGAYNNTSADSLDLGTTMDVAAGDVLVACVAWEDAERTPTVADTSSGNSHTMLSAYNYNTDPYIRLGYVLSASANSSSTFRASYGSNTTYRSLIVLQFRPDSGETVSLDVGDITAGGTSTTMVSSAFSTTGTDEVIVLASKLYVTKTWSDFVIAGSAGTAVEISGTNFMKAWYRIVDATQTTQTGQATISGSTSWVIAGLALKSAASGLSIPVAMLQSRNHLPFGGL